MMMSYNILLCTFGHGMVVYMVLLRFVLYHGRIYLLWKVVLAYVVLLPLLVQGNKLVNNTPLNNLVFSDQ